MVVTLGQQYNIGEEPCSVMLYTYIINRHAGTPDKTNNVAIDLYTVKVSYIGQLMS